MPKRCIVRMHRLDSRERVPACSSPQDPAQNACLPIANFAGPSRACPGTRYSPRIGGPLRVFFSAVYALSAPRTCTSRCPVKFAFSLRDVLLYVGAAGRTSRGAQHKDHRAFPLNPPIDETLISCSERAQDGWDPPHSIDESQVARLTSFEMRPAEWRHRAKLRKWKKDVNCAPRTCSASALDGVRVAEKKGAPVAITVFSLVSPYRYLPHVSRALHLAFNTALPALLPHLRRDHHAEGPLRTHVDIHPDMFATTTLCDQRARTILDFGTAPQNSVAFSMLGRLVGIPGAGTYTVLDRVVLGVERNLLDSVCDVTAAEWSAITIDRGSLPHPSDRGASVMLLTTSREDAPFLERAEDVLFSRGRRTRCSRVGGGRAVLARM
ncbi:hypothetical protein FB107DRAFT_279077 [Schizophyllum commune]